MSQTLYLKPAGSVKVRDPRNGEHLATAGAELPRNYYWLRRLKDGDVVEVKTTAEKRAKRTPIKEQ